MASQLPDSITIAKTIRRDLGRGVGSISGGSYIDKQDRWIVELSMSDVAGRRGAELLEGDSFEFAGAKWRVAKVYEPTTATRGSVADLVRISEFSEAP